MNQPKIIADHQCHNAEVPLWHPDEQCLYWSDIPQGKMFRYNPKTQESEQIYQGESVGAITLQKDGSLLLFKARGAIERWQEGKITSLIAELPEEREGRFNDAIADPAGRVLCGTMPTKQHLASLYRLDLDGSINKVLDGIGLSNGMGFTPNRRQIYHTDSGKGKISLWDWEQVTGTLCNQRVHINTPPDQGVPDGLTVDAQGYLWSARWNGEHLFRYSPEGKEVLQIKFPAKKVSCLTFGGPDYTDMYVTTAGGDNRAEEGEGAGAVFHLNLGIKGVPEFRSQIDIS